jgi:hypothetical protein
VFAAIIAAAIAVVVAVYGQFETLRPENGW